MAHVLLPSRSRGRWQIPAALQALLRNTSGGLPAVQCVGSTGDGVNFGNPASLNNWDKFSFMMLFRPTAFTSTTRYMQKGGTKNIEVASGGGNVIVNVSRAGGNLNFTSDPAGERFVADMWQYILVRYDEATAAEIWRGTLSVLFHQLTYSVTTTGSGATSADAGNLLAFGNRQLGGSAMEGRMAAGVYINRRISIAEAWAWQREPWILLRDARAFVLPGFDAPFGRALDYSGWNNHATLSGSAAKGPNLATPTRRRYARPQTSAAALLAGDANIVFSAAGAFSTQITMAGAANIVFTMAAALSTQIRLAGGANIVFTAAADISTQIRFAGAANIVFTTAADLSTQIRMAGGANVVFTTAADLSTQIRFAGGGTIVFTGAGSMDALILLAGAANVAITTAADLSTQIRLAGDANLVFQAAAALSTQIRMAGGANIVFSVTGDMSNLVLFNGSANISVLASGSLLTQILLAAAPTLSFNAAASLATQIRLAGAGTITFNASGTLITVVIDLYGAVGLTVQTDDKSLTIQINSQSVTAR